MYYEEKIIGGMMFCRSTPDGDWIPLSPRDLTARIINDAAELKQAHSIIADLLLCFDDGVGEDWNSKQLSAAREFCNESIYDERIAAMKAGTA